MNKKLELDQGSRPGLPLSALVLAMMAIGLTGCQTTGNLGRVETNPLASHMPSTQLRAEIPDGKLNTASRQIAAEGLKAMDAKDFRKASEIFNLAVKTDMTNSYLHFLNGVAYQMRGITGESGLFPLAEQGYQMAVQFDNSNWIARYYSGLLAMYQRNWAKAQARLAEAALYAGKQPDLLYDLAVASYYNHDPKTSAAALAGLRELQGGKSDDPRILRASAVVAASLNQKDEAHHFLDQLRTVTQDKAGMERVAGRVDAWVSAHEDARFIKAQFVDPGGMPGMQMDNPAPALLDPVSAAPGRTDFVENKMVVVDVVILSTEEDNTDAMGVNLLDGLKIQFGNPTTLTPGYSRIKSESSQETINLIDPRQNTSIFSPSNVVTRVINMPAVTYSLNIANANAKRNEVLARPTLVALGNQTSNFFSGVDVNAAAVSNGQGSAVQIQKEVGVKLAVTPEFLPNNQIKLNIAAERTFLAIPSASVKFDFRLDTTKTTVNANVVMKFGETLILSGLSERDQSRDRDGVPLLQDIPIVQYLFSRNVTRDYYKSVLILLTPRKAQYSNQSPEDVAEINAQNSASDQALAEFEAKYKPWFKPIPNLGEITNQLEKSSLYREFRTGDLGASWQGINDNGSRLKAALGFLFY